MWQIPSGSKGYTTQTSAGVVWGDHSGRNGSDDSSYEARSYNQGDECFTVPDYVNHTSSDTITTGSANGCKPTTEEANSKHAGNMYNWPTAVVGSWLYSDEGGEAPGSICPSGWRLPYGGKPGAAAQNFVYHSDHSYYNMLNAISNGAYPANSTEHSGYNTLYYDVIDEARWNGFKNEPGDAPIGFAVVRSGDYYYNANIGRRGAVARLWSSTYIVSGGAYALRFESVSTVPGTNSSDAGLGFPVRCVLR